MFVIVARLQPNSFALGAKGSPREVAFPLLSHRVLDILLAVYTELSFSSRAQVFVPAQACRTIALFRGSRPSVRNGAATCLKRLPMSSPTWRGCRTHQRRTRTPRNCKKIESAPAFHLYLHVNGASLRSLDISGLFSTAFWGRSHRLPRRGDPADRRCDHCREAAPDLQGHALCSHCDATLRMRRLCRLELQIRKGFLATVRPAPESAWEGASQCAACGKLDNIA